VLEALGTFLPIRPVFERVGVGATAGGVGIAFAAGVAFL
jgi:hypothetical protein